MPRVIVQPARNAESAKNYAKTVEHPISLSTTAEYLNGPDQAELVRLHPSGAVPLWGTTAGERGQMETRWQRISSGDIVLFTGRNEVFKAATVTHKFRSATLADQLWERKTTANGRKSSWEFMYAFNQPLDVSISYDQVKKALDGLPFPTREFSVLSEEQSGRIVNYLESVWAAPPPLPGEAANKRIARQFDEVDSSYQAKRRMEQSYLRQYLLEGSEGECSLCGRMFDFAFLVAAHIKKRSLCTFEEKIDIPAIAMLACKFGCDELYERGMVVVGKNGAVQAGKSLLDPSARSYFDEYLMDNQVWGWSERSSSQKYFEQHRKHWS